MSNTRSKRRFLRCLYRTKENIIPPGGYQGAEKLDDGHKVTAPISRELIIRLDFAN